MPHSSDHHPAGRAASPSDRARERRPAPVHGGADARVSALMAGGSLRERLGPGRPLPGDVRGQMERGLGAPLGDVRLHDGGAAAGLASSLGASAFAHGRDVGMAADAPRAGTFRGRLLLAHELAHAAQQARGHSLAAGPGTGVLEADADRAALGAVLGTGGGIRHASPLSLQLRK
ncbi:MAG TPA: DUF4157 domain-containing protein, partial [Longimicrobiaceae bacterium]|nr:DUF4157 domain-containing protein [Longimicrobiaceae bacterium]